MSEKKEKFTLGPWVQGSPYYNERGRGSIMISRDGEMYDHAQVFCSDHPKYGLEGKANAHLIAAAPVMYELLMELAENIRDKYGCDCDSESFCKQCGWINEISEVTKKARGEK